MKTVKEFISYVWENERITLLVIVATGVMLVTLLMTEPSPSHPEVLSEFHRRIGIEGMANIAANRREFVTLQTGDLLRFNRGQLAVVRHIVRDHANIPQRIGVEPFVGSAFDFNAYDEHCLFQITGVIRQGNIRYADIIAAREGRLLE